MKLFSRLIAAPLISGVVFLSCKEEKGPVAPPPPDVNVVAAGRQTVPIFSDYVGETFGASDVNIRSRVAGYLTSVHFKEGQTVQKGQLLYVVDDRNLQTQIDAAEAQLAQARTYMVRAKADLDRVEPLAKINALSQRDLDGAVANYNATKAQVSAAEASVNSARINYGFSRITSPITGVIGLSKYMVGDFVPMGGMGEPMNTISALGEIRVRFTVTEADYLGFVRRARASGDVRIGLDKVMVELVLADNSMFNEKGKLDLANREIDPETGSLLLQAVFPNKERVIRPGQFVKVRFKLDEYKDAIMVPQSAVNQLQGIYQVFVVNDSSKLTPRIVETGARVGSNWIISNGLKEGEKVAIIGSAGINPKNPVKPTPIPWDYDSTSMKK